MRVLTDMFRRRAMMMPGFIFLFMIFFAAIFISFSIHHEFEQKKQEIFRHTQHISTPTNEWIRDIEDAVSRLARGIRKKDLSSDLIRKTLGKGVSEVPLLHAVYVTDRDGAIVDNLSPTKDRPDFSKTALPALLKEKKSGISLPLLIADTEYLAVFSNVEISITDRQSNEGKAFSVVGLAPLTILKNRWRDYELDPGVSVHILARGKGLWINSVGGQSIPGLETAFFQTSGERSAANGVSDSLEHFRN